MMRVLAGQAPDRVLVTPHWWGMYKFQLAGVVAGYDEEAAAWRMGGADLARVDSLFFETFRPDLLHLSEGPRQLDRGEAWHREVQAVLAELRKLESKAIVDEYVGLVVPTAKEVIQSGTYDHVRILADAYGEEVFIAMNEGNPVCNVLDPHGTIGFVEGLIALIEKPDMMGYLMFRLYEASLSRVEALAQMGAHGYIGSETYCSCDLIAPQTYRDLILPAQKVFNEGTARLGLVPITYFTGDIMPILDDIGRIGACGLMVEEGKKGFELDVGVIRRRLADSMALFGNLDSVELLLHGSVAEVELETLRQMEASRGGSFIMASGSPIAFDTPVENIHAMIRTARGVEQL